MSFTRIFLQVSFSDVAYFYISSHISPKKCYNNKREEDSMEKVKKNDVIKVKVTGVQKYGAFVNSEDDNYDGLIHISEISYGYVKNVNDYLKIGDTVYAEVVDVNDDDNQLKLSIKDIDYKKDGTRLKRMAETKEGFTPLKDNLEIWINKKIKEITDKM